MNLQEAMRRNVYRTTRLKTCTLTGGLLLTFCPGLSASNLEIAKIAHSGFFQTSARLPVSTEAFEVASIRPCDPEPGSGEWLGILTYPGGKVVAGCLSLNDLIGIAYGVQNFQIHSIGSIHGSDGWMRSAKFNITAIPAEDSKARRLMPASIKTPPDAEQRDMLKALLADRFALKMHSASQPGRVYLLERGKGPLKLLAPKDTTAVPFFNVFTFSGGAGNGEMQGVNASMALLASSLSQILGRPVLDQTGLSGSFDLHVPAPDEADADITNATLQGIRRLGLNLVLGKGPVESLIVESAQPPSPN